MGAMTGSGRTAEQTEIARFWELTGPATYNTMSKGTEACYLGKDYE